MNIINLLALFPVLLAVVGCGLANQTAGPVATPKAYRATMELPGQCSLTKAQSDLGRSGESSSGNCVAFGEIDEAREGRSSVVVGFFDDELVSEFETGPIDWEDRHERLARSEQLAVGSHNETDALPVAIAAVPQDRWPAGANFCGRVDWEGRDNRTPQLAVRSREYTCFRHLPDQGGTQFVQFEFVEYRPDGRPPAAMDPRATADAVFASLRLGGG